MANTEETISKFGTVLKGQNQRVKFTHLQTRYRVRFIGFGVTGESDNLSMDMQEFNAPSGTFTDEKITLVNGEVHYPGQWSWGATAFKVYNSYDNLNYKALYNQIQRQRDIYNQVVGDAPKNYKFTTIFEHTDGHQNTLSMWVGEGCYLTKAVPQGGSNQTHSATTIDCEIQADNWTLYDENGLQIPTANAGVVSNMAQALAL